MSEKAPLTTLRARSSREFVTRTTIAEVREIATIRDDAVGWLYFIQHGDSGPIKIGRAVNPRRRLSELQQGAPEQLHLLAAMRGGAELEKDIHASLRAYRIRGEWFDPDAALTYLSAIGGDSAVAALHEFGIKRVA